MVSKRSGVGGYYYYCIIIIIIEEGVAGRPEVGGTGRRIVSWGFI